MPQDIEEHTDGVQKEIASAHIPHCIIDRSVEAITITILLCVPLATASGRMLKRV